MADSRALASCKEALNKVNAVIFDMDGTQGDPTGSLFFIASPDELVELLE